MTYQQIVSASKLREAVRNQRYREDTTDFTESLRPRDLCEPCEPPLEKLDSEAESRTGKADPLAWEMVALWIFVAVSFAALFLAGYVIWTKCNGRSPY